MGFTHYYKIKVYVDNGLERFKTWKYVFAKTEDEAIQNILRYYDSQYDTIARVVELYTYPITDVMMFSERFGN